MAILTARTEFASALNQVCHERGIEPEVVIDTIKEAVLAAFRRDYGLNEELEYEVSVNPASGETKIQSYNPEKPEEKQDVTPPGFGRIAAQVAKQVILQKIREAEKEAVLKEYAHKVETMINGMVLRFEGRNLILDIGKAEGMMPVEEQIPSEQYRLNQRLTVYVVGIHETHKGKRIIISRAHTGLVEGLFRREVPEVASGAVVIKGIAREAGARTKIAVASTQAGVDPIGSCVGQKGIRVQEVIKELNKEKIDIIQYSPDPVKYIIAALAPAEKVKVKINEDQKEAIVTVPEDQLSLAIGKEGQNVRLAAKLTGYRIDIQDASGKSFKKPSSTEKKAESELIQARLSKRTVTVLEAAGYQTLIQLQKANLQDLSSVKGIGPKALAEIKKII